MKFKKTKDRPAGAIVCTHEDIERLKAKGWTVDMHTPYYANFIGIELSGLAMGFGSYMDHLEVCMAVGQVGYYSESWEGQMKITSQKSLNLFIKLIDTAVEFAKTQTVS